MKIRRRGSRYRVTEAGKVKAEGTTGAKAKRQARLARGVAHGWHPPPKRR